MKDTIIAKIKALPPFDDTMVEIQNICMDKNSSLSQLSKVIERDPMLTANILKSANSPLYGFSREVKNIKHAVSLFGMATIKGFALSSAIRQNIKIDLSPYNVTNEKFLQISNIQSALMMNWYSKIDHSMLDVLVPASFLMEVGKIVLANELIETNKDEEFKKQIKDIKSPDDLSQYEKKVFGFNNEQIAAMIFEQWNLEIELVEAIRFSDNPNVALPHIMPYALALKVDKTAVNIFEQLSENSFNNALELLKKNNLNQKLLIEAKDVILR